MADYSWNEIKQLVYLRAYGCCEYCRTAEANTGQTMQIDHIHPNGGDDVDNLCLSCWNCNNHKREATQAVDPSTGEIVPLFNPREDRWENHFEWIEQATRIQGKTASGRATVVRLKMNRPAIIVARQRWVAGGFHPPNENT